MKHFKMSVAYALVCAAIACRASATGLVNGGFESGNLNGWTVEYATYLGNNTFSPWSSTLPSGHPPALVVSQYVNQSINIPAFQGAAMAQLNAIGGGGYHATRIRQTVANASREPGCVGLVRVHWGAVLVDGGHPISQQPFFEVHLEVNGVVQPGNVLIDASAAAQPGSGWTVGGSVAGEPMYWKTGQIDLSVVALPANTNIEVVLTVADCNQGGHDGLALIDAELICSLPCQVSHFQPIPRPFVPNTFTPNGNGINDTWVIGGVYGACNIHLELFHEGGAIFHDVWFARPDIVGFDGPVTLWDGVINGSLVQLDVYVYKLTVKNCTHSYSEVGKILVLY